jgi:hypothetical protein
MKVPRGVSKQITDVVPAIITLTALILIPSFAYGQMFSVENRPHYENNIPPFGIYAGAGPAHFHYRGTNSENNIYSFDGEEFHMMFEARNIKLFLGTGLGLHNISYFAAGLQGGTGVSLYRSRRIYFQVPLRLYASFTTVSNNKVVKRFSTPEFRQGIIGIGAGLDFDARLSPLVRLKFNGIPGYGFTYSTSRNGSGGGVFKFAGNARLFFDHLFGKAGLSLGYNYKLRVFNIKGTKLDYNSIGNSFLLGITF